MQVTVDFIEAQPIPASDPPQVPSCTRITYRKLSTITKSQDWHPFRTITSTLPVQARRTRPALKGNIPLCGQFFQTLHYLPLSFLHPGVIHTAVRIESVADNGGSELCFATGSYLAVSRLSQSPCLLLRRPIKNFVNSMG